MRVPHIYWHIYPRDQIRPELQGNLLFLVAIPAQAGAPVVRDVVDPAGRSFPSAPQTRLADLSGRPCHGIVFQGVSKRGIYGLLALDPVIDKNDTRFAQYNRRVVANSREFFLIDPAHDWTGVPPTMVELLSGCSHAHSLT